MDFDKKMAFLYGLKRSQLQDLCRQLCLAPLHADDIFRSAYKELSLEPWKKNGLPKQLSKRLQDWTLKVLEIDKQLVSSYDRSVKFLFRLSDGQLIESVLMPERNRVTLCVSSQVGCAQACSFCHTGRMGLKRNLKVEEIVAQLVEANRWMIDHPEWKSALNYPDNTKVSNLVFMGMGEPLDNVENLLAAIEIMTDPYGLALAPKRISVSTAGHLEGLEILFTRMPKISVALSLHATNDKERSRLMPINRKWPLEELLFSFKKHYENCGARNCLLIQYTVIHGVNDSMRHADEMIDLLSDLPVKVNLIPLNPIEASRFEGPAPEALANFRDRLHQAGYRVMIRYSKGQDISAACGQLVVNN